MKSFLKSTILVFFMIQLAILAKPGHTMSCDQVQESIATCIGFLTTGGGNPSDDCCNGVKKLKADTPTADDKRRACKCLKVAASRHPIKIDAASSLPKKCGVDISIDITNNYDCNKIE